MSSSDKILTELRNGTLALTLNYPEKMNCMGFAMLEALDTAIARAETDPAVRAVTLEGAGKRAFSTGADLKEFNALAPTEVTRWIQLGNRVIDRLEQLPKPTVAILRGYAYGGGLELALGCDFRLADTSVVLRAPELTHGWLPGWGGLSRLRRLIGEARAKEVVLLAPALPAQKALQFGLVNAVSPPEELRQTVDEYLGTLLSLNGPVFGLAKNHLQNPIAGTGATQRDFDVLATYFAKYTNPTHEN